MRRIRTAIVAVVAAGALSLIGGAASAGAAKCGAPAVCIPLSFNNAVLDVPGAKNSVVISPSTAPLNTVATVTTPPAGTVQSFTIDPLDFDFPAFSFTDPVAGTIDARLNGTAAGSFNSATGQVTLNADIIAEISVLGNPCSVDTGLLTFSTEGTEPLPGVRFPPGPTGVVTGAGAITASWATLPPGTGAGCPIVNGLTNGPGGLWISRNITPAFPTDAALDLSSKPSKKNVDVGKTAKFKAKVSNTGETAAEGVEVCAKPANTKSKKALKVKPKCRDIGALAGESSTTKKFKVKTKKSGKFKVKFTASGTGLADATDTSKLKVRAQ
jgi:hypothetical protein